MNRSQSIKQLYSTRIFSYHRKRTQFSISNKKSSLSQQSKMQPFILHAHREYNNPQLKSPRLTSSSWPKPLEDSHPPRGTLAPLLHQSLVQRRTKEARLPHDSQPQRLHSRTRRSQHRSQDLGGKSHAPYLLSLPRENS